MRKNLIIAFVLLLITSVFWFLFQANPEWVERFYSTGMYVVIINIISSISALVPFSLNDIFYFILILYFLTISVLVVLRKIKFIVYLRKLAISIIYLIISFFWLWGFNYYRPDIYTRLDLKPLDDNTTDSLFLDVFKTLTKSAAAHYLPPDFEPCEDSVAISIDHAYQQYASVLKIPYPCGKGAAKPITLSHLYAQSSVLGYYGPWLGEVHLNSYLTQWDKPTTLAHEKAHRFGITSEGEANFYAWLICSKSTYQWNRYASNIFALSFFINQAEDTDLKEQLIASIPPLVWQDILARSEHWSGLKQETIEKIGSKINDTYLKTAGVEKGVQDYNEIVRLILTYFYNTEIDHSKAIENDK